MDLVTALREAAAFYRTERPRGTPPSLLNNEIGPGECEAIANRLSDAADEIERLRNGNKTWDPD